MQWISGITSTWAPRSSYVKGHCTCYSCIPWFCYSCYVLRNCEILNQHRVHNTSEIRKESFAEFSTRESGVWVKILTDRSSGLSWMPKNWHWKARTVVKQNFRDHAATCSNSVCCSSNRHSKLNMYYFNLFQMYRMSSLFHTPWFFPLWSNNIQGFQKKVGRKAGLQPTAWHW